MGMDVKEFTHLLHDFEVEIVEELIVLLEERTEVVRVKLKEGALAVGRLQCVPMDAAPGAVVADADIADQSATPMLNGNGEGLLTIGSGDDTTVTVGLLDKRLAGLQIDNICAVQLLIPLNRAEVGSGKKGITPFVLHHLSFIH